MFPVSSQFESWRSLRALQQPDYADPALLAEVVAKLRARPGLVFAAEIESLLGEYARAGAGDSFILMGGDCAESFAATTLEQVSLKLQTLQRMSRILADACGKPVVKVGRMAGQYAKPRSHEFEEHERVKLPVYRGDAVNGVEFSPLARVADPQRLLRMYEHSLAALGWMRSYVAEEVFYSSHEALLLEYEAAMLRRDPESGWVYDTSGHFLWVGERTRIPEGAHVQFLSKVRNPLGVKLGATADAEDVLRLAAKLNPLNEPGRFTVITRMGAERITEVLPPILERVKAEGLAVTWLTDPMHGNTILTSSGIKTRHFDTVMREVEGFFAAHRQVGTKPGGLHIELTGDDVTEVIGGAVDLNELDLQQRYESLLDPRLNRAQAVEMAARVAAVLN